MEKNHPALDYSEITPLIFIGRNACCLTHFHETLVSRGVRADISLEEDRIDQPFGAEMFLWLPTEDHMPMTHEKADLGITTLQFFEKQKIPCYVHCKNGHGRGPMLVAAYLMASRGMTADEAVKNVREHRPSVHLQDVQMTFLRERETYTCAACGFRYKNKDHAIQCQEACETKGVCRSDLAKHTIS